LCIFDHIYVGLKKIDHYSIILNFIIQFPRAVLQLVPTIPLPSPERTKLLLVFQHIYRV
jgi:hypothetical protein